MGKRLDKPVWWEPKRRPVEVLGVGFRVAPALRAQIGFGKLNRASIRLLSGLSPPQPPR